MTSRDPQERLARAGDYTTYAEDVYGNGGSAGDILPIIEDMVSPEEVSKRNARIEDLFYGDRNGWVSGENRLGIVREALVTEKFLQTLQVAAGRTDDIDYFRWLIEGQTQFDTDKLSAFSFADPTVYHRRNSVVSLGKKRLLAATVLCLHNFCDRNPVKEAEAIDAWQTNVDRLYGLAHVAAGLQTYLLDVSARSADGQRRRTRMGRLESALQESTTENRWRQGTHQYYRGTKNSRTQLAGLELVPTGRLELSDVQALHEQLLAGKFTEPLPAQLIAQSLNASVNFLHSLRVEYEAKGGERSGLQLQNAKELAVVDDFLQGKRQQDKPIGFGDMIKLANLLSSRIATKEPLERLDARVLEDYPKAIDRLMYVVLAKDSSAEETPTTTEQRELFAAAAACIKLLAFKGAEKKLQQRVLTLGDLLLRYQGMHKEDARNLLEQIRLGSSEVAVQGLYRHLHSRRGKTHAAYRRFDRGYGYIS